MTKALPVRGLKPSGPLAVNARKILKIRVAEFYALASTAGDEHADEALLNLRIAAKRLRYTLELFISVFGERGQRNLERLKLVQEELGAIHDIDVRIELIKEELLRSAAVQLDGIVRQLRDSQESAHRAILTSALRPPPDDPRRGLYAVLSRQAIDRKSRYHAFVTIWNALEEDGMRGELVALTWEDMPQSSDAENADALSTG